MRKIKHLVPLWLMLTATLIFVYNNCSKVNFDITPEALKQQILEMNSASSLLINGGAPYTNQKQVQLSIYSPRGTEMKISNQADCSDGSWEPYATAKQWTLAKTDDLVSVYAQFKDLRGDISICVNASITHDDIAPVAVFSTPSGIYTNKPDHLVQWTASDNLSGVDHMQCNGSGVNSACNGTITITAASEGSKLLSVTAIDKAGNISPSFVHTWYYDATPPTVSINAAPAALTGSGNASLSFSAVDSGSGVDKIYCQLDALGVTACSSPFQYSGLGPGAHTFKVYATDLAGNQSAAASATWTVDMTAPTIQFTQTPPAYSNSSTNAFAFTGTKNGAPIATFECHLDSAAFAACTSPLSLSGVSEGTHAFEFRGIDALGNVSSPLNYTWVVDLTAPIVAITSAPNALTGSTQASFTYTATDALSGVKLLECKLDAGSYSACAGGSINYSSLQAGAHTFTVRATDLAGNTSTATKTWSIDLTPPVVTITAGPDAYTRAITSAFSFTATDASGISGYECKVDNGSYAACTSPYTSSGLNEGSHIFYVRATDNAGNVSDPATRSWTIDLSPPIIRVISAPASVKAGDHVVIQYQVVDLASGVASVKCGLSTAAASPCQATATIDLGSFTTVGSYTYQIDAVDNVGNEMIEKVNFSVTAVPVVCDPFVVGGEAPCNGGLVGSIYYLDSTQQSNFKALSTKTVDYFYSNGTKVNALLNLKQLFVSTRSFSSGFPTSGGSLIQDNTGATLTSYFAFHLNTVLKLDALNDTPGWYQFATLSDDGSVVNITPQAGGPSQLLINNDGDTPTRMGCGQQAIYLDDTTRLGMEIKYCQGPPTEIALVLMWKKVSDPNAALDQSCGTAGGSAFFGPAPYTDFTNSGYGALVNRGWRVVAPANFIAPPTN